MTGFSAPPRKKESDPPAGSAVPPGNGGVRAVRPTGLPRVTRRGWGLMVVEARQVHGLSSPSPRRLAPRFGSVRNREAVEPHGPFSKWPACPTSTSLFPNFLLCLLTGSADAEVILGKAKAAGGGGFPSRWHDCPPPPAGPPAQGPPFPSLGNLLSIVSFLATPSFSVAASKEDSRL